MRQKYIPEDWVKFEGKLARIVEVNYFYYLVKVYYENYDPDADDDDCYLYKEAKDVEPIPLTIEILEKNGWVWSDEHEELAFGTAPIAIYPESDYFMVYNLRIKLRYVHQLQNLLFGLGINHEMEV